MLLLERLERQVLADRQGLLSRGVTENLPSAHAEQKRLDEWLNAEPQLQPVMTPADLLRLEELTALGLV